MARERKFPDAKHYRRPLARPNQSDPGPMPTQRHRPTSSSRPTKWKDEFLPIILQRCAAGDTDAEIGRLIGVSPNLMWKWRQLRPELKAAMNAWREKADDRVVRALYERAIGYTFESEVIKTVEGRVVRVKTVEHVPPDVRAAEIWLMNRRAGEWRAKQEVVYSHSDDPRMLTDEELLQIIAQGQPKQIPPPRKSGNGTTH